jgi:hypothetical protein
MGCDERPLCVAPWPACGAAAWRHAVRGGALGGDGRRLGVAAGQVEISKSLLFLKKKKQKDFSPLRRG